MNLYFFLFFESLRSLYHRTAALPELFTKDYWRYRKASRILRRAISVLRVRNVVGSDWEAIAILIDAYWRVETDYYLAKAIKTVL